MSLCSKCKYSVIAKGESFKQRIVYCREFDSRVNFEVEKCSEFKGKLEKSIWDMQREAWVLEVRKGRVIGFMSPTEAREKKVGQDIPEETPYGERID
jgi:hypothetical protein